MTYSNLWLSVNALILDIVLLTLFYEQKASDLHHRRMFLAVLLNLLALNLIGFIYTLILMTIGEAAISDFLISWLASLVISLVPMLFLGYLNSVFYYDAAQKRANGILTTIAILTMILVLVLGPAVICTQRSILLRPGRGPLLVCVPACLYLGVGFVQGYLLKKSIAKRHLWALRGIFVVCVLSLSLFMLYKTLSAYGFMMSLAPLLAAFTLEGKGILVDRDTGMRSSNAFRTSVIVRLENKIPFRLILVHSSNLSEVLASLDEKSGRKVMEKVSSIFRNITSLPTFRLQEDTFAILQDERNELTTQELLINLRARFLSPLHFNKRTVTLHVNACVADLPKVIHTGEDLEILIELLEEHSNTGVEMELKDLDVEAEKQTREEIRALSRALRENRLEVFYQPILNTATGTFDCAEALIRMKDENGNYIRPDHFIPAAERSGLIIRVGQFVLREVCSLLASDVCKELGIRYIEANLSVEECIQENLPEQLESILAEYHVHPNQLNIEVTETANDTVSELMMQNMSRIHEKLGIELSLDDFGTGYSNLARLLSMPVDIIKFDRSMLLKAFETESGRMVFTRMAQAVHDIGRKIVSEGVETEEQAAFVKSNGIEFIQGFYYSKPLPKDAYLEFVRTQNQSGKQNR